MQIYYFVTRVNIFRKSSIFATLVLNAVHEKGRFYGRETKKQAAIHEKAHFYGREIRKGIRFALRN